MKQLIDSRNAASRKMQENKAWKQKYAPNFHRVKEDFVEIMDLDTTCQWRAAAAGA